MRFEEGLLKCRRKSLLDGSCLTCESAEMCRRRIADYEAELSSMSAEEESMLIEEENERIRQMEQADMVLDLVSALHDVCADLFGKT